MSENREGDKSSGYRREYCGKNTPAQGFQSNVPELKDAVFTINPNQADADNLQKTIEAISSYVVQNYDAGILLAKGLREGKLLLQTCPARQTEQGGKRRKERKEKEEEKGKESRGEKRADPKIGDHHRYRK